MDYKLRIFKEVAYTLSFTQAAKNLSLSQPAVSKTVKGLEEEYGNAFFERNRNQLSLTPHGHTFLTYAEKILSLYQQLEDNFSTKENALPSAIKLGASTTLANYILPPIAAKLQKKYPHIIFNLISGNTDTIQQLILTKQLDFGIVEGNNHNNRLAYEKFIKDELVLVTNPKNAQKIDTSISTHQLANLSFIKREQGSGTREVIEHALAKHNIAPLQKHAILGSTESIKSYLYHSNCYAFLSIHAVSRELLANQLCIVEVQNLEINRWFYFTKRQGDQSLTSQKLQHFFKKGYNQKE